jgi:hypothetical protein
MDIKQCDYEPEGYTITLYRCGELAIAKPAWVPNECWNDKYMCDRHWKKLYPPPNDKLVIKK